jgi:hypothetical protein
MSVDSHHGLLSITYAGEDTSEADDRHAAEDDLKENGHPHQISVYSHIHQVFTTRRMVQTKGEVFARNWLLFRQSLGLKNTPFMISWSVSLPEEIP